MDIITKEKRSRLMAQIRSKDTAPELAVRSMLHKMGYRFRLHRKDLPGSPDIVLPKYFTAIFVHGCFWHRHKRCKFAYVPKSNKQFWKNKFAKNTKRDMKNLKDMKRLGWNVLIIWECQTKDISVLRYKLGEIKGNCKYGKHSH